MSQAKDDVRKFCREKIPDLCAVMKNSSSTVTPLPQHLSTLKLYPLTTASPAVYLCLCCQANGLVCQANMQDHVWRAPRLLWEPVHISWFLGKAREQILNKNPTRLIKEELYVPRVRSRLFPPLPAMASSLPRSVPHRVSYIESFPFSRVVLIALLKTLLIPP